MGSEIENITYSLSWVATYMQTDVTGNVYMTVAIWLALGS